MVKWALSHRKSVIAIALVLLVAGGAGVWSVGTEFLPAMDEGLFIVEVEMTPGTGLTKTDEVTKEIEGNPGRRTRRSRLPDDYGDSRRRGGAVR